MRDKTKALALLGSMVLLGAASVHSLRQEKSERNNNYNENLRWYIHCHYKSLEKAQ